jgi:PIN domain nuclease of toxin-antitoxin system
MIRSVALPDFHKDPFDRLLIAQALQHSMILVSKDALVAQYDVPTIWF